jgi:CubicO group peptidase (beta-lactamase class C family)
MKGLQDIMYASHKDNDTLRLDLVEHIQRCPLFRSNGRQHSFLLIISVVLILSSLVGYTAQAQDLKPVEYAPLPGDDWKVSTPAEQGLDPMLVAELYRDAAELETLYGLLVIKNGYLIAERYFNEGAVEQEALVQSVSKSYISALVGIALDQGCLSSLDQKMMDFFPEFADQITDPRKMEITIRDLLQMRAGYPWEETDPDLWEKLMAGDNPPLIADFPLISDPGTEFNYSNLTTTILAMIVTKAGDTDLKLYAQEHLLSPIDSDVGTWYQDSYNYYYPLFHFTTRDMAKLGLLYLNNGEYEGNQVLSADWVKESLQDYSEDAWVTKHKLNKVGLYFRDLGYGYQWWSARVGDHHFSYAAGHGGQLIVLLDELDLIIVTASDPFWLQHDDQAWKHEKSIINLVGRFILSLSQPSQMPPRVDIHEAAVEGDIDATLQHIKFGSDLNEKDVYSSTPLIIAATFGKTEVALALIEAGADLNIKNNDGSTALHTAAFFCHVEIVEALLDKGADKDLRNNAGSTALEAVTSPFDAMKGIYDYFGAVLEPYGLELNYERIRMTRPKIAEMLQ